MPNFRASLHVVALAMSSLIAPFAVAQSGDSSSLVVQDVTCTGNRRTSCDFIRDHLYLQPGQPLAEDEIRNAALRLSALRNFETVNIRLEKGRDPGSAIVVIDVAEADPVTMEWLLGASSRLDSDRVVAAGRLAHQNLFGKGKIADLAVVALAPVSGDETNDSYDVSVRYADPQLFGSRRWFGVASLGWRKQRYEDRYGNFGRVETPRAEFTVGRRIADFSYLAVGMVYRRDTDSLFGQWESDGTFDLYRPESHGPWSARLIYGRSTEDDLHFPTEGSAMQITLGGDYEASSPEGRQHFKFRKTWPMAGAFWTVKIGGEPSPEYRTSFGDSQLAALSYARPLTSGGEIQRGRWYVEPGLAFKGYTSHGGSIVEYGLKAGIRADTRTFGYVDLYLLATRETTR